MTWIATLLAVLRGAMRSPTALQGEALGLQPGNQGRLAEVPCLGCLHYHYERAAA